MNIFKALSGGNGRISETNITSFMSYLLDSSNELHNSFFLLFIELIDSQLKQGRLLEMLRVNQNSIRERILHFSSEYMVSAEPEYHINGADGSKQIPDILLRISRKETGEDVAVIIIENKINRGAFRLGQVERQVEYFLQSEDFDTSKQQICAVLITPDERTFENVLAADVHGGIQFIQMKWVNHLETDCSIEGVLRKLIRYEQNAEIAPIDPNTQFIIKSFIDFLASEFSRKEVRRKNFSFMGFEVSDSASAELDGVVYYIKKFSNNMIRLFDEEDNLLEAEVLPILRQINAAYHLNVALKHSTGKAKNTQILGREIIARLNEKD